MDKTIIDELTHRIEHLEKIAGYDYKNHEIRCSECQNNQFRIRIAFNKEIKLLCKCGKVEDIKKC